MLKYAKSFYLYNIQQVFTYRNFRGWGRKKTGIMAYHFYRKFGGTVTLLEDGFIRSVGLGVNNSSSFSQVEDDIGIYYDSTVPSKLETILNTYNFTNDIVLMQTANKAMSLIKEHHISKYNNAPDIDDDFFSDDIREKILIIAQTAGDASLKYGLGNIFNTKEMIDDAMKENPQSSIYIKIHPDVLSGKKKSDITLHEIPKQCIIIDADVNPISLLKYFKKVYTKTSGMGMEALMLGLDVVCYGVPYYAGWGLTVDKQVCSRRTKKLKLEELFAGAYILYTKYSNPFSQKPSNIIDTIQTIIKYRSFSIKNEGSLYFFGFSRWKQKQTKKFFHTENKHTFYFCNGLQDAKKYGLNKQSKIFIWGKKPFKALEKHAKEHQIPIVRVEDGFIRSVSLGSDLTKAYSLVVDTRGIYFDPTQESDLEYILNTHIFDEKILERSRKLQHYLIEKKISKYNSDQEKHLILEKLKKGQTVIMVPGQVEDDASIIYGGNAMTNLKLLQKARHKKPDAYIIYKPHPDVLAGNRKGHISTRVAMKYCDMIVTNASIDSVLSLSDEIHTITSLVGMEGLIRGKIVYTYGLPFYAGWGLTIDTQVSRRRVTNRTLDELVSAAYILYPRYIHPETNMFCEVETLLTFITKEKKQYVDSIIYRVPRDIRNYISRKVQLLLYSIIK